MEVNDKYIRRYWEKITADQLYDEYTNRGYEVERELLLSEDDHPIIADLYATKDNEKIIIEIISSNKPRALILRLYDIAQNMGAELKLVYAKYAPLTMKNGFEGFESSLEKYFNEEYQPGDFDLFAIHNRVDEIMDAEFSGIYINRLKAEVSGSCTVDLMAWQERDDPEIEYFVPCKFVVEMEYDDKGWYIVNHKQLDFDTSQLN